MKISVVINTYNAELYLGRVLESVKRFDEILLCDMYSTDSTIEIAQLHGCRIIFHQKTPYVEPARQFAISQASFEWVLVVDADEVIPEPLVNYLYDYLSRSKNPVPLYLARKNYFMGRFMRSAYPDHNLRFLKRDETTWPAHIHSHPLIKGKSSKIPASLKHLAIDHLADDTIEQLLDKYNVYTTAELERRAKQKISIFKIVFSPLFRFVKFYILKLGFLDGMEGLIFSIYKAQYKFITLSKILFSQRTNRAQRNG